MGRPQITGNQACPKCKNLGRVRMKKCRCRSTARYVKRSWFRHNDKTIPEHYIDNFTRFKSADYEKHPFGKTLKSIDRVCDDHDKTEHAIKQIDREVRLYHGSTWSHDEKWRFYMALDKVWKTVIVPAAKKANGYRKLREFIRTHPALSFFIKDDKLIEMYGLTGVLSRRRVSRDRMIQAAIDQGNGPLLEQINYLFEKYEIPRRRKRDEVRRQKLKMWEGRPLKLGIEEELTTSASSS